MSWSLPHMENAQPMPNRAELVAEFAKAEIELGNAIFMHRAAWVRARERRDEIEMEMFERYPDERERRLMIAAACETDKKYERRIGDVRFWREERACLAATVTALAASINARPRPIDLTTMFDRKVPRQRA